MTNLSRASETSEADPVVQFRDQVALSKSRLKDKFRPQGYSDALRSLLSPALRDQAWASFVASDETVQTMEAAFILGEVTFVLVVLPCPINPIAWTETQLREGRHFAIRLYSSDQWQGNEPVHAAIPQEIWHAGVMRLPATKEERSAQAVALLEAARARIKAAGNFANL